MYAVFLHRYDAAGLINELAKYCVSETFSATDVLYTDNVKGSETKQNINRKTEAKSLFSKATKGERCDPLKKETNKKTIYNTKP